jgi:glycosyltransferase involved in cell wall biosynthesis
MITTEGARHGPEVAYLQSGRNGFIVPDDAGAYAQTVLQILGDDALMARIRQAADQDAKRYTLSNMVDRFVEGIDGCLAKPPRAAA